jgi:hypothetical protein
MPAPALESRFTKSNQRSPAAAWTNQATLRKTPMLQNVSAAPLTRLIPSEQPDARGSTT